MVHLALDGGLRQDLSGLLEGGGGQEGIRGQRCLGDAHQQLGDFRLTQGLAVLTDLAGGGTGPDLGIGLVQLQHIHHGAGEQIGVSSVLHAALAHHLAYDDFDMLVVDVHALLTVHPQDFLDQVVVDGGGAPCMQHVVGVERAVVEGGALLDNVAVIDPQPGVGHGVHPGVAVVGSDMDVQQRALVALLEPDLSANLGQRRHLLGFAGLKQFLNTGKTLGDVAAGHAAGVEGTHGQLGAGLADGLGRDDADSLAGAHRAAGGQVHAVAAGADAALGPAGQHRADLHLVDTVGLQHLGVLLAEHPLLGAQDLAGGGIHDVPDGEAAPDTVGELLDDLPVFADLLYPDAFLHAAVILADDNLLGDVHQAAGQVAGVCGTQGGIGHALPGASGGDKVLQHAQALAEVGLDGDLDGAAGGVGHQAAHTGQLADLLHRAAGAGGRHHVDGVELLQIVLQGLGHIFGGLLPLLDNGAVALVIGHKAHLILILNIHDALFRVLDQLVLLGRHGHVVDGDGNGAPGGVLVAGGLDVVQHLAGHGKAVLPDGAVNDLAQLLLAAGHVDLVVANVVGVAAVHKAQILWDIVVEDDAPGGDVHDLAVLHTLIHKLPADLDGGVDADDMVVVGQHHLVLVDEHLARPVLLVVDIGQVVGAQDHILGGDGDRAAVLGTQEVVGGEHQQPGLSLGLGGQGDVDRHLVAVEVGVEGGTGQGVQLDRPALHQDGLECLDAQAVQGGGAVEHDGVVLDDHIQGVPHLGPALIHHLLGGLDVVGGAVLHQLLHDEGAEQLQRHLLGQAALVNLQLRADHDNRAAGVVHALAQQVLAEPPLLALEHIAEGFERPVVGAGNGAAPAAVVDEGVHSLLEHPLLVADDDIRGIQLDQPLQAVVAVDDTAVQIVEVAGGEAAAVQLHHGADLRGDHRQHVDDHPLGLVAGEAESVHHLQALNDAGLFLAGGVLQLGVELVGKLLQVNVLQQLLHSLGAHAGLEVVLILLPHVPVFLLAEDLVLHQRGLAGIGDDIVGEVQHLLQDTGADVQQQAHPGGDTLEIPDMADRGGQLDVAHALPAHLGARDLHAAAVADLALIADLLVLAAVTLPVLGGPEDTLTEQAVPLRLQRAVVDGLRPFDLAVGPLTDHLRRSDADLDRVKCYITHVSAPPSNQSSSSESTAKSSSSASSMPKPDSSKAASSATYSSRSSRSASMRARLKVVISSSSSFSSISLPSLSRTLISRHRACSSLTSTLKDSGTPGLGTLWPLTIAS